MAPMHRQLELLVMLHDLDLLLRECKDEKKRQEESELGFEMAEHHDELINARKTIIRQLDSEVLTRYEKLLGRYDRAVAPVIDGICYGCYMRMPTSVAIGKSRNEMIHVCGNCGRFLYWVKDKTGANESP